MNSQNIKIDKISIVKVFMYILLLGALMPYIYSGNVGDDILNSLLKGECINNSQNLLECIVYYLGYWISEGRTDVLFSDVLSRLIYYFVTNRQLYKLLIIIMSLASVKAAEGFISYFEKNERIGLFFLTICVLFFPIYVSGSNSVAMYWGFMQLEIILFFRMLHFLEKYFRKSKKVYLVVSLLLFFVSMFSYVLSYMFIAGIAALCFYHKRKKELIPFGVIWVLIVCLFVIVSGLSSESYDGTSLGIQIGPAIYSFAVQFLGAIPFSYLFTEKVNNNRIADLVNGYDLVFLYAVIILAIFFFFISNLQKDDLCLLRTNTRKKVFLYFIALLLWGGSAFLIAISKKYQREIPIFKAPHIPVYVEFFGLAIIFTYLLIFFFEHIKLSAKIRIVMMACLALLGSLNWVMSGIYAWNWQYVTKAVYGIPQDVYERSIRENLFEGIDGNIIIDVSYSPTIYPNFFAQYSGKKMDAIRLDTFIKDIEGKTNNGEYIPQEDLYITKSFIGDAQQIVYVCRIESVQFADDNLTISGITVNQVKAWCHTENDVGILVTSYGNEVVVYSWEECNPISVGNTDYLLTLPDGLYNYFSFTYWN